MPSYDDYADAGGTLDEAAYDRLAPQAWAYLDTLTFGRAALAGPPLFGRVESAHFALVDELARQESGGEVLSASNDGYSETYAASGRTPAQRMYDIAARFLAISGLLYRGW